ncbi:hypothetical protein [Streptomyces sp. NPDC058424]|uniref:hypothetical protein n=1 Tax=Streptomyces sp. NPDC058424 TaxID=3346491 RepID=UPI0036606CF5
MCDRGFGRPDPGQLATRADESPLTDPCDTDSACVAKLRKERPSVSETHRGPHHFPTH